MRLYYAQNKEDLLIKGFFPDVKKGFYIDVGANDPVLDSVTKIFYDEGWSGVNIEPIRRHFEALSSQRKRDINLQLGLSNKPGELTFREYSKGDGLSTFDPNMKKLYEAGEQNQPTDIYKDYKVKIKTLGSIIKDNNIEKIHFIKIDVEGYEYEVIKGYSWEAVRPELICVEANHIHKDWRTILQKNKYHEVFFDGINNYYLAEEALYRKDFFNYADAVFSGNPIYYPAYKQEEKKYKKIINDLKYKLEEKEQETALLHQQQRDVRFLAKRLVAETQVRLNRRAKGIHSSDHLYYAQAQAINKLVTNDVTDKDEILEKTHTLDSENIHHRTSPIKNKLKSVGWKVAASTLNASMGMAKKMRRHGK